MKHVTVLRGGPSNEYAVSMQTGSAVLDALNKLDYPSRDIIITKNGEWLENGRVKDPEKALEISEVVFIALHGAYGEDGQVQRLLQRRGIPFTGSNSTASIIAFNKELTKKAISGVDVKTPRHRKIFKEELDGLDQEIPEFFKDIGKELFVKPVIGGSSFGANFVPNEATLRKVLNELLEVHDQVLVEEFIRGREATVGVLNDFRNEKLYALPVIEIVPPRHDVFYSSENKYDGSTELICPGRFSYHEKSNLLEAARAIHETLGCAQYSRSDFIVRNGEVYFLETNTLPGLTEHSNFPKAAASVGLSFEELINHLVKTATV